jgi:hypothetical protein
MAFEPVGERYNLLNPPSNYAVKTPRPIVRFHCVARVNATLAPGVTAKALGGGIRAYLRQILWSRGGSPIHTWGTQGYIGAAGWCIDDMVRAWLKAVPQIVDVAATPAEGTFDYYYSFVIPIALPPERYSIDGQNVSAVRVKPKASLASDLWTLTFRVGDINDFVNNAGASVINSADMEVVAETDETLDAATPDTGLLLYANPNSIALPLSAGVRRPFDLPRDGLLLAQGQLAYDDSALTNAIIENTEYVFNTREVLSEQTWLMQQFITALNGDAAGNYPVGLNYANWDVTYDLANALDVPAATNWQLKITHGAPTNRGDYVEQMLFVLPTALAFQRQARG